MLCIGYAKSETDEGSVSAERTPHPSSLREADPLPQGERVHSAHGARYANLQPSSTRTPYLRILIHLRDLAAQSARVLLPRPALGDQRAQGMPGAQCARSLACENKKAHEQVTTVTPETPGIPRAMVLTVSFALSRVTGLVCHPRPRKLPSANLTPASGRQDHTTSPSAANALRLCAPRASTASRPASVTIASRPSSETGQRGI
jgi:hypothetical protein